MIQQPRVIELEAKEPKNDLLKLKREGTSEEALKGYALKLLETLRRGDKKDLYLVHLCIEQMAEILGLTSEMKNWTTESHFQKEILPRLRKALEEVQTNLEKEVQTDLEEDNQIIEELAKLTSLKLTSQEYRPSKRRTLS